MKDIMVVEQPLKHKVLYRYTDNHSDIFLHPVIEEFEVIREAARGVLPNDLKTELVVKANLREWRNIFKLRTSPAAHPDKRRVMIPLLRELKEEIPVVFDDIEIED